MKKFWQNNKYLTFSMYAIFVVIVSILFYRVSSNTDNIAPSIAAFFKQIFGVLAPIFYGLLIAYLFNPIMCFFERYFLKAFKPTKVSQKKQIRALSIVLVYLAIIGTVILMFRYIVPEILTNIKDLFDRLPQYTKEFDNFLTAMEIKMNDGLANSPFSGINTEQIFNMFNFDNYFNAASISSAVSTVFSTIMSQAYTFTSSLFNWIMGLVIAFYALQQKEAFAYGSKRVIHSLFSRRTADKIISIFSEGNQIFINFFVGKFIDSLIIGIICFIGLSILRNPYALLLAFIVGVFNMIPYFGPLLGAIPAVLITLFEGLIPAVSVGIFIFILQQFDGLVLGPKILGDSIGLSPFWIISGILIGGALWGPLGMFFASPIIAILLLNINRHIDKILGRKEVALEEPYSTSRPAPNSSPEVKSKLKLPKKNTKKNSNATSKKE